MDRFPLGQVTLMGVGLLGGSLGLALGEKKLAGRRVGYVRRRDTGRTALDMGVLDHATCDPQEAVRDADLVIFCTPLSQMRPLAETIAPVLRPDAIVTDVGSVKATVVRDLEPLFGEVSSRFIGGHPMAGSEKSGVDHARADLFHRAVCILTPTPRSDPDALARVRSLWDHLDSESVEMSPEEHDTLVSRSSHLPHFLASALARYVLHAHHGPMQPRLCASGFHDTSRVASGSPEMWRDIALANREALLQTLEEFQAVVETARSALSREDAAGLESLFLEGKTRRDAWVQQRETGGPDPDPVG